MHETNKNVDTGGIGSGGGKSINEEMISDWKAWWNVMPSQIGGSPTLHVVGNIDVCNESTGASIVFDCWTFPKKVDTVKSKLLISWPVRIGLESYSPV